MPTSKSYPPVRPLVAIKAVGQLIKNPDDTTQVFRIIDSLRGKQTAQGLARFAATPVGQQVLADRRALLDALVDRQRLAKLPRGTLGREYHEFLAEERLTAEGLTELERNRGEQSEDEILYANRMRDTHDLLHIMTGYGRDPLGEVCVLAFTHAQIGGRGINVIATLGLLKISRELPGCNVQAAIAEARRRGRRADCLPDQDWEAMLSEPVTALRRRFGLTEPVRYRETVRRAVARYGLGWFQGDHLDREVTEYAQAA